jgi:pyrimidine operon attenuation protein / uracil phosphoribosyltransferase
MSDVRTILETKPFQIVLDRLCYALIENYDSFQNACIIGVQPRGTFLADRIVARLQDFLGGTPLEYGKIDITFYRDDFHLKDKPILASETQLDFPIEGKKVILVDDVLYTGRTILAAMTALGDFGRPERVETLVLVDRRFNRDLPIYANYKGLSIDAIEEAYVKVFWADRDGEDKIRIYPHRQNSNT